MNTINCLICLSDFDDGKKFTCCDTRCTEYICFDCLKRYIEISDQENSLPTCPREKCEGVYDEETIDKSLVGQFRNLLIKHYRLVKKSDVDDLKKRREIVKIIKDEKMKFLIDSMPFAIKKVAQIAFMVRLSKIKKVQYGRDSGRVLRTCITLVCNGFLNENFKCSKCSTVFCKECEEEKQDDHVCNESTVQSVKAVNKMVCCPSCKTKIEKAEGCMAITCAVCKTNFWYNTGEKGASGNHGKYNDVVLRKSISLTEEYREFIPPDYIDAICEMEHYVTDERQNTSSVIDKMLIRPDEISPSKFSKLYSEMVRENIKFSITSKKLILIEKILKKREPGYENEIIEMFGYMRRISASRVITNDSTFLFLDSPEFFANLSIGAKKLKVDAMDVKRQMELGDGIHNGFFWSY